MASLGFSGVMGRPSEPATATFKNTGTAALTLTDIGTTGPFRVVSSAADGCAVPQTLAPGASCAVSVVFVAPAASGDSSGQLKVTGAAGETRTVPLAGRAVVTNAGGNGSSDDNSLSGGGAVDLWTLLCLAALGLAAWRARRPSSSSSL